LILSLEIKGPRNNPYSNIPDIHDQGLISFENKQVREAIIGMWMAALIASGRSSLFEVCS
jgi:hypothetical protein